MTLVLFPIMIPFPMAPPIKLSTLFSGIVRVSPFKSIYLTILYIVLFLVKSFNLLAKITFVTRDPSGFSQSDLDQVNSLPNLSYVFIPIKVFDKVSTLEEINSASTASDGYGSVFLEYH